MLEVHLFGTFRFVEEGLALPPFPTRAAKLLFSFLILQRGRSYSREILSSLLAGDAPERIARKKLRQELWRMRSTLTDLTEASASLIKLDGDMVGIDSEASIWIDTEHFERALRCADACDAGADRSEPLFRAACDLYTGPLLEGEYASWCLVEQDRFRVMHQEAAARLIDLYAVRGAWSPAVHLSYQALRHDPLDETMHRRVIAILYLQGDRTGALRHFSNCRRILQQELAVEPMPRTLELIRAIKGGDRNQVLGILNRPGFTGELLS